MSRFKSVGFIAITALASVATAQVGSYTWQASADSGLSWSSVAFAMPGTLIKIRLVASWSGVSGTSIGYAGGQFDATLGHATTLDTVSNLHFLVQPIFPPNLAVSPYSGGLKIDSATDTSAPGEGSGWLNPGQPPEALAAPGTFNSDNPVVLMSYDFFWVTPEPITIGMVINPVVSRAMAIYTSPGGTQTRMSASEVTVSEAHINFPAPHAMALLGFGSLITLRRTRSDRCANFPFGVAPGNRENITSSDTDAPVSIELELRGGYLRT